MSKIVLDEITSGYQLSKVNENFQKIEDELNNKVLYRNAPDGETNTVEKDIDLNGKKLYNVGDIQFQGFDSLEDLLERTTTAAEESEASKDAAEVAAENAAISAASASTYSGSAVVRTFSGDGSTVAFNLTASPLTKENTQVYIGSVYQRKSTYSVTDNILTFNTAPPVGTNNIEVVIFESVFVEQSGYTLPVLYGAGIVLSQYNQLIEYNNEFYKLKAGQAPYTTTGTWGTDSAKLVAVGDAALRQELTANANDFNLLPEIANYAALQAYTGDVTAYYVRGVASIFDGGAGVFRVDASDTTTADNGGTVLVDASGRRWKREFSGAVILGWFGGDKTGASDAQAETQSAVDAAPLGGSVVCDGLYKIGSTVTISKPLRFIGFTFGYASQRIGFINEADTALKMFAVRAHYVSFEKMLIVGAGKSGTSIGIEIGDGTTNYDKFSLSDDAVVLGFSVGVEIKTQNAAIRSGATVSTCGVGVRLVGLPTTTDRRNIYFNEANLHSCDVGLDVVNPFYAVGITGCDFNSCGASIRGSLSASSITGNNFIYSSGTDIDINVGSGLAGNSVLSNTISGNQGSGTGGGIKITGDGSAIVGNIVRNKGGHGIAVFGGLNTVEGNISIDSDYFNSGSYDNIHIAGNVNIVGQNVARNTTAGASRARYGINIASGFGNVVALNRTDGNVSGQINNSGSSTIINKNSGYVTENRGSATISVGSTTVVVNHGLSIAPPSGSIALTMTSNTNVTKLWISNVTSTQFTINANVDPGIATQGIWWSVT